MIHKDSLRTASKHTVHIIKFNHFILYREIIAVCSGLHTNHIINLGEHKAEILNVEPGRTYASSNNWVLKS